MSMDKDEAVTEAGKGAGGGESGGGAYPNPHSGKKPAGGGFMGHGGQTEIDYSGPGNPNATTDGEDERPKASNQGGTGEAGE